jgi:hypothetical protein
MTFIAIMGANLAMGLITKLFSPKPPQLNADYFSGMDNTMKNYSKDMAKVWDKSPSTTTFSFDFQAPDPPEGAMQQFGQMVSRQEGERVSFLNDMNHEKNQMKDDFYKDNHMKTEKGSDGKSLIAMEENGKAIFSKGAETQEHKQTREAFENGQKTEMFSRHLGEKNQFVEQQKQQFSTFLDSNKFQLQNPGIQNELQRMIADGQKKALKLQDKHEEEFYKIDLPTEKMKEKMGDKLQEYKDLREEHENKQKESPEGIKLAKYQQDLVALLDEKRAEAREKKKEEMFLQDPRKTMKNPPKQELASVFPMNVVTSLEAFGITDLPA